MDSKNFMSILCERDNRIHGLYAVWARNKGINYNVLAVLCSVYQTQGCTQRHICDEWCLAKQTVNTTCKELIGKGLLASTQNTTDRRETSLVLTESGYSFIEPICAELKTIEQHIYETMGKEKVEQLLELYLEYTELTENQFRKSIG